MKGIILNFLQKAQAYIASMVDYTKFSSRIIKNLFYYDHSIKLIVIIIIVKIIVVIIIIITIKGILGN